MALDTSRFLQRNQDLGWYQSAIDNEGRIVWSTDVSADSQDYAPYEGAIGTDISAMRALRVQSYQNIRGVVYLSIRPACLSIMQPNHGLDGMYVYLFDDSGRLLNTDADAEMLQKAKAFWNTPNGIIRSTAIMTMEKILRLSRLFQAMATVLLHCCPMRIPIP